MDCSNQQACIRKPFEGSMRATKTAGHLRKRIKRRVRANERRVLGFTKQPRPGKIKQLDTILRPRNRQCRSLPQNEGLRSTSLWRITNFRISCLARLRLLRRALNEKQRRARKELLDSRKTDRDEVELLFATK